MMMHHVQRSLCHQRNISKKIMNVSTIDHSFVQINKTSHNFHQIATINKNSIRFKNVSSSLIATPRTIVDNVNIVRCCRYFSSSSSSSSSSSTKSKFAGGNTKFEISHYGVVFGTFLIPALFFTIYYTSFGPADDDIEQNIRERYSADVRVSHEKNKALAELYQRSILGNTNDTDTKSTTNDQLLQALYGGKSEKKRIHSHDRVTGTGSNSPSSGDELVVISPEESQERAEKKKQRKERRKRKNEREAAAIASEKTTTSTETKQDEATESIASTAITSTTTNNTVGQVTTVAIIATIAALSGFIAGGSSSSGRR
jgi:hypothetical protein